MFYHLKTGEMFYYVGHIQNMRNAHKIFLVNMKGRGLEGLSIDVRIVCNVNVTEVVCAGVK
jgi:hypothetical protein